MSRLRQIVLVPVACPALTGCGSSGQPSGAATAVARPAGDGETRDLELSDCMRTHGLRDFPDPALTPPHAPIVLFVHGMVFASGSSFSPKAPAFQRASRACRQGSP